MAERTDSMDSIESTETVESPATLDNRALMNIAVNVETVEKQRVQQLRKDPNYQMFRDSFMRKAIPQNLMITTDAKEVIEGCVIACIDFISVKAKEKCHSETRGMVTEDDILYAMTTARFDDYLDHLHLYMQKYRVHNGDEASTAIEFGEVSSGARKEEGERERGAAPKVVEPENMLPLASAGDPPTGRYAASPGAPPSGHHLAKKSREVSSAKKEGEEERGAAPKLVAPEYMPPPALASDSQIGGNAAYTIAPLSELELASIAFDEAIQ